MAYNPFSKPLGASLDETDLLSLVELAAEGYFIEFKREFPSSIKVARSLASLANTAGGWYIVGMNTDDNNVASQVCGFDRRSSGDPIAKVRDIAKSRIDPMPVIYPSVVHLSNGRIAMVVFVPGEQRTPFVTDDGRVYRRAHDASDPIPEDRRHAFDRLLDRGRSLDRHFSLFCTQEREPEPMREEGIGWLNLYLMPEPLGLIHRPELTTRDGVEALRDLARQNRPLFGAADSTAETITGSVPFDHAQVLHGGARLRRLNQRQLTSPGLTMEVFTGGSARVHIPVGLLSPSALIGDRSLSEEGRDFLIERYLSGPSPSQDAIHSRFFDVGSLLLQVLLLVRLHADWLGDQTWWPDFRVGFSFRGFWSAVPFVDAEEWRELVKDWGMPMVTDDIQVPDDWGDAITFGTDGRGDSVERDLVPMMAGAVGLEPSMMRRGVVRAVELAAQTSRLRTNANGA